jgi:hypothetical protein
MRPALAVGAAVTLAVLPGCHRSSARTFRADDLTQSRRLATSSTAFARYPLIAFSKPRHGAGGTKEFLASLIRQPGFAGHIQDLVVESEMPYQDVVDRYMAADPVARAIS